MHGYTIKKTNKNLSRQSHACPNSFGVFSREGLFGNRIIYACLRDVDLHKKNH